MCSLIPRISRELNARGGYLIHLPDISQARLNAAAHVLFAAIVNGSHLSSS